VDSELEELNEGEKLSKIKDRGLIMELLEDHVHDRVIAEEIEMIEAEGYILAFHS